MTYKKYNFLVFSILVIDIFKFYTRWLISLIVIIFVINIVFHKFINIVSFTNLFLIIVPNWLITFYLYLKVNKLNKSLLETYMNENHKEKLDNFYKTYIDNTNPNSKPIFALFMDKQLLQDSYITNIKTNANQAIMLFVCTSGLTIMSFLISTVFIVKVMYFK